MKQLSIHPVLCVRVCVCVCVCVWRGGVDREKLTKPMTLKQHIYNVHV